MTTLPPIVQEYRANYKDVLEANKNIKADTHDMVDDTEKQTSKMAGFFGGAAKVAAGAALAVTAAAAAGIAAIVKTGIQEAKDASAVNAQLEAGIKSTGGVAGTTLESMNRLASSIQAFSGQTDDSIAGAQSLLLTFTNIRNVGADKIFDKTTLAAANMAAKLGGDAASQATLLGKALNDPTQGLTALTRVGVAFTDAQKDQIKALQESGDLLGAQKVILAELEVEFGGAAEAAGKSLPGALARGKRAFEDLSQSVVEKFLPIVTPAINWMVDALQAAAPIAEGVAGRIADGLMAIPAAITAVKDAFNGAGPTEALGPWQSALQTLGEGLAKLWEAAQPVVQSLKDGFDQLAPIFAPLIGQLVELYTSFSPMAVILKAILPVLPVLVSAFVDLGVAIGGALGKALTTLLPLVSQIAGLLAGQLAKIVQTLVPIVVQLATSLGAFLGKAIETLLPVVTMLVTFIGELLAAVLPIIDPILQLVMAFLPLLDPILQLVSALLPPLIDLLTNTLTPILALVSALVAYLIPAFTGVVEAVTGILKPAIDLISGVLGGLIDFITGVFTGNWDQAWGGIVKIFTSQFEGLKGILLGVMNGVIDIINGIIGGIAAVTQSISSATGGAINFNVQKLSHLSFDVGTSRVPGPTGSPLMAEIHGGEAILSNAMLSGNAPIPPRVQEAVNRQQAAAAPSATEQTTDGGLHLHLQAITNASAKDIASELGWEFRKKK